MTGNSTGLIASLLTTVLCSCSTQTRDADSRVIAVVLNKKLTVNHKDELDGLILYELLERFAKDNKIEPTEQELTTFILKTEEMEKRDHNEREEDRKWLLAELKDSHLIKRQLAQAWVRSWKINKALYAKYGGRVVFQQGGPEPLDAYRNFLNEEERKGSFQILDKQYEAGFWRYFTNDEMHTFYDNDEGVRFMNTPWWMTDKAAEK